MPKPISSDQPLAPSAYKRSVVVPEPICRDQSSATSAHERSVAVPSISGGQPASKVIRDHTSYLNYHLVEDMVEKFGDDELKTDMKEYLTNLKKFRRQTTVSEFLIISSGKDAVVDEKPAKKAGEKHADEKHAGEKHAGEKHADEKHADEKHAGKQVQMWKPEVKNNYTELSMKLDKEGEYTTMEDVERIRKNIAHELSLPPHAVLFCKVEEGSVEVKFWVKTPSLDLSGEGLLKLKNQEGILEIRVDGNLLKMFLQEGDISLEAKVEVSCTQPLDSVIESITCACE